MNPVTCKILSICTDAPGAPRQWWFGGGTDLTPAYIFEEDVKHFHSVCEPILTFVDVSSIRNYPLSRKFY